MRRITNTRPLRRGFTLVELLVSMGLTLFIMTILVEAFGAGMETFSSLRSLGELQTNLRSGLSQLKNDLSLDHFEGGRRLSDQGFWNEPRREGFFAIVQNSGPTNEGPFLDGQNSSYRATDHVLHFAARQRGNRRDQYAVDAKADLLRPYLKTSIGQETDAVFVPSGDTKTVASQWSEIAYFLMPPNVDPKVIDESGVPLFNLFRVQLVVLPNVDEINTQAASKPLKTAAGTTDGPRTSRQQGAAGTTIRLFSPNDLADKTKRSFKPPTAPQWASIQTMNGMSLVCSNVVSFHVRGLKSTSGTVEQEFKDFSFDSGDAPPNYRLVGVQIILRVYDPASGLTRQATLVQDL